MRHWRKRKRASKLRHRRKLIRRIFGRGKNKTKVEVDIYTRANGDFVIEGFDVGRAPREVFGDSDYEYWLTVRAEDRPGLFEALGAENVSAAPDPDELLLDLIEERFGDSSRSTGELEDFLDAHGINYEFEAW